MSERKTNTGSCYENSKQHLGEMLIKLDTLLNLQILRFRNQNPEKDSQNIFHGIYIDDDEVDHLLNHHKLADENQAELLQQIAVMSENIAGKAEESLRQEVYLPFYHLTRMFRLSPFEMDILLICLAPQMDARYEKLYAYLQDDMTRKAPSPGLIMDLLCANAEERVQARACFIDRSPLRRNHLLRFDDQDGDVSAPLHSMRPLISRDLVMTDRIVNFLLGYNGMDRRSSSCATFIYPRAQELLMDDQLRNRFLQLTDLLDRDRFNAASYLKDDQEHAARFMFYLRGSYGAGRKSLAESFCYKLEVPLIIIDCKRLLTPGIPFEDQVRILCREALLNPAVLYFDQFDCLGADQDGRRDGYLQETVLKAAEEYSWITFLAGEAEWRPPSWVKRSFFMHFHVPRPSFATRKKIWNQTLNGHMKLSPGLDIDGLAGKFLFTGGQIRDAVMEAQKKAFKRGDEKLTQEDLHGGCREQCNDGLARLARKISPVFGWDDIVLPKDKLNQLKEIRNHVKYKQQVYEEWGFGKKFVRGKGLIVLFSGPSGTGKTMSAEIIAGDLGMELYKINLSSVVSKYIGETEKNLEQIFKEAETAGGILFFDEADALFGKRTDVKDAHDRYANIEVNYLLQKMEEYEGAVIMATNLSRNIDDAFTRRIHFTVDFPFPDETYRMGIWERIFPMDLPRAEGIDLPFLARQFKLSGGNIKNIAVNASFLAADQSGIVEMTHLVRAVKREFQKLGRICSEGDFGEYFGEINRL